MKRLSPDQFTDLRGEFGMLQGEYAGVRGEFPSFPRVLLTALRAFFAPSKSRS